MPANVCPIAVIDAPVERVWDLLYVPAHYDQWWEAETESIEPAGPAQRGQVIHARLGAWWHMTAVVEGVEPTRHHLDLTTHLPFGITGYNHITCSPLADGRCQVMFG